MKTSQPPRFLGPSPRSLYLTPVDHIVSGWGQIQGAPSFGPRKRGGCERWSRGLVRSRRSQRHTGYIQEPLENLSQTAQQVHACLVQDPNRTMSLEEISEETGLTPGETADALRGLEAATRAAESFGGWSVVI